MVVPQFISTFRHELASTILVSLLIGVLMWPINKVKDAWTGLTNNLEGLHTELKDVSTELAVQRNNCLTTLQDQGKSQIELLTKTVDTLGDVRLELAKQTGFLQASSVRTRAARRKK
jgi:hypothetical protein